MIITGSTFPGEVPPHPPGTVLLASLDVEWSKNYRIRNGSKPFCFSVTWLALAAARETVMTEATCFWHVSAYIEQEEERGELVAAANAALAAAIDQADLAAGHQLCSDLAVLAASAEEPLPAIAAATTAWRRRREPADGTPAFLDTRYDAGHLLAGPSRRLVDVCTELQLDVTQPELRGTSMTALHRRWLDRGVTEAREKITVLNLRHSLSTALVAARAAGLARWKPVLNVNRLLAAGLGSELGYTAAPAFTALLGEPGAA